MANKMLIDATHPEETRVVVVRGNRVEEFDFEAANRKQLRGNIYLAKVTRVEPSLQAAFVDYGGNRHGFLAFSEIHPDYYQIPVADRQALLDAEEAERAVQEEEPEIAPVESKTGAQDEISPEDEVETVGSDDAMEEVPVRRSKRAKQYKIQEVIKRRQIILVQVVKEERGNKGAALTTYLSLAGRYSVLMPNTARGGGISRKITNVTDRKRLKKIASELDVPEGMGVILRTAGANRTKVEIKRDFEYLLRLWENVRDLTLESSAPTLVYEEGSLIKRSIRDLYNKDIEEILVSGDEGYKEAKGFMRMLMPSHAKHVQPYRDQLPVFTRFAVEAQLDAMFSPQVTLRSGGYIVIDQTEALVSIDVNSGKSTREHNIEDTALATNLEASEEISRQLRLRDLAGLVVIDFIDMEEKRNNRSVEKRMKDCLKSDRARIQVGRISHFGLMEMSRQRIRTGVLESSMDPCPHCHGTGHVRASESVALHVLRAIEAHLLGGFTHHLVVRTRTNVALYILNQKRSHISEMEVRFGVGINLTADDTISLDHLVLENGELLDEPVPAAEDTAPVVMEEAHRAEEIEPQIVEAEVEEEEDPESETPSKKRRKRRRRRRGTRDEVNVNAEQPSSTENEVSSTEEPQDAPENDTESVEPVQTSSETDEKDDEDRPRRSRRRGRRGGRRNKRGRTEDGDDISQESAIKPSDSASADNVKDEPDAPVATSPGTGPISIDIKVPEKKSENPVSHSSEGDVSGSNGISVASPQQSRDVEPATSVEPDRKVEPGNVSSTAPVEIEEPVKPKKKGWWQGRSFF